MSSDFYEGKKLIKSIIIKNINIELIILFILLLERILKLLFEARDVGFSLFLPSTVLTRRLQALIF